MYHPRSPTHKPQGDPVRCLYINWNDGTSSQYTVTDNYHLPHQHTRKPRSLRRHTQPLPEPLTILDDDTNTEILLDTSQIRSAYLLTINPDRQILQLPT